MKNLKLLRIETSEFALFNDGFVFDFIATDRVLNNSLFKLKNSLYLQNTIALSGVNASGKTTALKFLSFVLSYFLEHKDLSEIECPSNWFNNKTTVTIYFYKDNKVYKLISEINKNADSKLFFDEEIIFAKNINSNSTKKTIFDFQDTNIKLIRSSLNNDEKRFLKNDSSISLSITSDINTIFINDIKETNLNMFRTIGRTPNNIINFLDENIEYIEGNEVKSDENEQNISWKLKFKNSDKIYSFSNSMDICKILSSGTIRGNNLLNKIISILVYGGYLLVDEIENHFNKKIVESIIGIFMNPKINRNGATLIFTTHYVELLDTIDRKDNVYILRKKNNLSSELVKLSDEINRNDLKKSDLILANKIFGSVPKYNQVENLNKFLLEVMESKDA